VTLDPAVTTFPAPASSQPLPLDPLLSADELLPLASSVTTTPESSLLLLLLCLLPWSLLPPRPGPPAATRACAALKRPDWYLRSHRERSTARAQTSAGGGLPATRNYTPSGELRCPVLSCQQQAQPYTPQPGEPPTAAVLLPKQPRPSPWTTAANDVPTLHSPQQAAYGDGVAHPLQLGHLLMKAAVRCRR
jgi:hypothetical protein